ncbi:hypothetical protein E4U61_001046 [Claviceps capensis]|nr:hypothetical protein E4U61_001046 [Claviceps capensis]
MSMDFISDGRSGPLLIKGTAMILRGLSCVIMTKIGRIAFNAVRENLGQQLRPFASKILTLPDNVESDSLKFDSDLPGIGLLGTQPPRNSGRPCMNGHINTRRS